MIFGTEADSGHTNETMVTGRSLRLDLPIVRLQGVIVLESLFCTDGKVYGTFYYFQRWLYDFIPLP